MLKRGDVGANFRECFWNTLRHECTMWKHHLSRHIIAELVFKLDKGEFLSSRNSQLSKSRHRLPASLLPLARQG